MRVIPIILFTRLIHSPFKNILDNNFIKKQNRFAAMSVNRFKNNHMFKCHFCYGTGYIPCRNCVTPNCIKCENTGYEPCNICSGRGHGGPRMMPIMVHPGKMNLNTELTY